MFIFNSLMLSVLWYTWLVLHNTTSANFLLCTFKNVIFLDMFYVNALKPLKILSSHWVYKSLTWQKLFLKSPGILLTVILARSARLRFLWAPLLTEYRFSSWKHTWIKKYVTEVKGRRQLIMLINANEKNNPAIFFQPALLITCQHPLFHLLHYSLPARSFFLCS